jgi:hypothetical protein
LTRERREDRNGLEQRAKKIIGGYIDVVLQRIEASQFRDPQLQDDLRSVKQSVSEGKRVDELSLRFAPESGDKPSGEAAELQLGSH